MSWERMQSFAYPQTSIADTLYCNVFCPLLLLREEKCQLKTCALECFCFSDGEFNLHWYLRHNLNDPSLNHLNKLVSIPVRVCLKVSAAWRCISVWRCLPENFPSSCRIQQRSLELAGPNHPQEMPPSFPWLWRKQRKSRLWSWVGGIQAPTYKLSKGIHFLFQLSENIFFPNPYFWNNHHIPFWFVFCIT